MKPCSVELLGILSRGSPSTTNTSSVSPIANFDNSIKTIVNADAPNVHFYTPNFDPNSEASAYNWMSDPSLYGSSLGYKANEISVPAGQVISDGKWTGAYSGTTMRMDVGLTYDVADTTTLSAVAENVYGLI